MLEYITEACESRWAIIISAVLLVFTLVLDYCSISFACVPVYVVIFICGLPIFISAVKRLVFAKGILRISSALLVSLAIIAAVATGDFFAAAEVAFIMALGEMLEDWTVSRTRRGISKLVDSAPKTACKLENGQEYQIPVGSIDVHDILRVRPGEMIPVDGVIVNGNASIDASSLTGESVPELKQQGDVVMSGTIATDGALDIEALKPGTDGSLQRIIKIVRSAGENKARVQTVADRWASILVPLSLLTAIATWIFTGELTRAVAVLVVFCPCALVLATPTAIVAAIGQATKHGVIIKSGGALEVISQIDRAVFDKTGTLTHGRPEVNSVLVWDDKLTSDDLVRLAAVAEGRSEHPLAKAIVRYAQKNPDLVLTEAEEFAMTAGRGIRAQVEGHTVICGSASALIEEDIILPQENEVAADDVRNNGFTAIFIAVDKKVAGCITFADALKDNAVLSLEDLKQAGVNSVILSGDHKNSVARTAASLGVTEFKAELLPSQKLDFIRELQQQGHMVLMTGDGINDAPALKTADVGVAMGVLGSDLALEAADVALMKDDLSKLPYLRRLSQACASTIRTGITISLVINLTAIVLSILGMMTPAVGAVVHNAGSCFVILFASLLYDRKLE